MCTQRSWDYLHFASRGGSLIVNGRRSDGLFVKVEVNEMLSSKLANGLNVFESYRSCQCTNLEKCEKHKEKK